MDCPECGREAAGTDRFCGWCGASLAVATPAPAPTTTWVPTHRVPAQRLATYLAPGGAPGPNLLDPHLEVMVTEWREAWAHVVCSNGWQAWVDGRQLIGVG